MVRSGRAAVDAAPDCLLPLLHAASATAPDPTRNDLRLSPATTGRTYRRTMAVGSQVSLIVDGRSVTVADDGASLLEVLARPRRDQVGEGRVQSAGTVRVLHRARRRRTAGRVRDAGAPGGRPIDHHAGRHGRTGAALGRRVLRDGCEPVRLLHAGHHRAARRVARARCRPRRHRPRRACAPRTPVPVHRLAHDPRCVARRTPPRRRQRAHRDLERASARARRSKAVHLSGSGPTSRSAVDASPTTPPLRTRSSRCPTAAGDGRSRETLGEARRARGEGAGPADDCCHSPPDRAARRRLGGEAADPMGRAGVSRDGRVMVRARAASPTSPLANGGAFGGKVQSFVMAAARELADRHGRAVRVLASREDSVRLGPKRPPIAAGVRADGSGVVRVARTPGVAEAITSFAPSLRVEEVDVAGPPTSCDLAGRRVGRGGGAARRCAPAGRRRRRTERCARACDRRRERRARARRCRSNRSTRSCFGPSASVLRTWHSAGSRRKASPSTTQAIRSI